jgi:hypothetical protein
MSVWHAEAIAGDNVELNTQRKYKAILKIIPLNLKRLPIMQIIFHDLKDGLW